jgi:beta-galactosidase
MYYQIENINIYKIIYCQVSKKSAENTYKKEEQKMHFGAAYYPEYWPRERWKVDARLMREAGFDIVRIGEFAWRIFEPEEDIYDFELFDDAIKVLGDHGIQIVLCTPTAAIPAWVEHKYPYVNVVDVNGQRRSWGARKNWCYSNPKMRELSRKITTALAEHYASHPNVVAWQTDNEFSYSGCYCEHCVTGFRHWLAEHYESPEALNRAWGLRFWSMEVHSFDEIIPPRERAYNPSHMLDYRRFHSDQVISFNKEQLECIKAVDPKAKVTHNFMTLYSGIDYSKMARDLDFVANDMYPKDITMFEQCAYGHDVIRGYNGGAGFWMHELQCGYINRENQLRTPPPGMIRLWTYQAVAHGADTIIYFRWRSCTGGYEQFHSGIVQHDGDPKSRSYREIKDIGREIERLRKLSVAGSQIENKVAILRSFDMCRAMELYYGNRLLDYDAELLRYYRPLLHQNVGVDIIHPEDDLSRYRLVFAPLLMLVTPEQVIHLSQFVKDGGTLVTSYRLGAYDKHAVVTIETLPGDILSELFGCKIHEYDCLMTEARADPTPIVSWNGQKFSTQVWADMLEPTTAEVLAYYTNEWYASYAAITRNQRGKGHAIYVGAGLEDAFYEQFVPQVLAETGFTGLLKTPRGVSVKSRIVQGQPLFFIMNYTTESKMISLPHLMQDVLLDRSVGVSFVLPPRDVVVLR